MPQHDPYVFVSCRVTEDVRHGDVHARGHRILLFRAIQLDTQDASGAFRNNVTHGRPPPCVRASTVLECLAIIGTRLRALSRPRRERTVPRGTRLPVNRTRDEAASAGPKRPEVP